MEQTQEETLASIRKNKLRDVISLVLAKDANTLRHEISEKLWNHLEESWPDKDALGKKLNDYGLSPSGFNNISEQLFLDDIQTLNDAWDCITKPLRSSLIQEWGELPKSDNDENDFNSIFSDKVDQQVWETSYKTLAKQFTRYSYLYRKIVEFWDAWRQYSEQKSEVQLFRRKLLETWENLFSLVIAPTSYKKNKGYHLHIHCPDAKFLDIQSSFFNIDPLAYKVLSKYMRNTMKSIQCSSKRKSNSGIRSLSYDAFNYLHELQPNPEHCQAILLGCRSGVQYPVLGSADSMKHPIIGMVAVYFPLYNFFNHFELNIECDLLIRQDMVEVSDNKYKQYWYGETSGNYTTSSKYKLIDLVTNIFHYQKGKSIQNNLELLSSSYNDIYNNVMQNDISDEVKKQLNQLEENFNPNEIINLCNWFNSLGNKPELAESKKSRKVKNAQSPISQQKRHIKQGSKMKTKIKTININEIRDKVDVGILTIRQDETEAILHRFPNHRTVVGGKSLYTYSQVETHRGIKNIVMTSTAAIKGQTIAQAYARNIIDDFNLPWLFLVGIAGGLPNDEYTLGDVILANRFLDFSLSAAINGTQEVNAMGACMHKDVSSILSILPSHYHVLKNWSSNVNLTVKKPNEQIPEEFNPNDTDSKFYGEPKWQKKTHLSMKKHFPSGILPRRPKFHLAPSATGNIVVKDTVLATTWKNVCRDIVAIEMELGGVFQAAYFGGNGDCRILPIRGLSDIVGYKRTPEWTLFACHSAASFAYEIISKGIPFLVLE